MSTAKTTTTKNSPYVVYMDSSYVSADDALIGLMDGEDSTCYHNSQKEATDYASDALMEDGCATDRYIYKVSITKILKASQPKVVWEKV
jgi:hypothetical protein